MTQSDIYPDFLNLQYTEDIVNMNMYLNSQHYTYPDTAKSGSLLSTWKFLHKI